ncbi:transcriptional regulator domain-containing protein [Niveispirillum cyanobacteriorum]|uniref:transcriptional regulator domain-containing protein n=1 Tax=Niveispirillum cyanobacteriorum TaxID=1612173 RepID=UPI00351A2B9B
MQNRSLVDAALSVPDWQDAAAYQSLQRMDRAGWAWQWLRRNGGFKEALKSSTCLTSIDRTVVRLDAASHAMTWGLMFRGHYQRCQSLLATRGVPVGSCGRRRAGESCDGNGRPVRPGGGSDPRKCRQGT